MARAAEHFGYRDVLVARADRDAVVAGCDVRVPDGDPRRSADVDAVGVGAVFWGFDVDVVQVDVAALVDDHVEEFAVQGCEAPDGCICHMPKFYGLDHVKTEGGLGFC